MRQAITVFAFLAFCLQAFAGITLEYKFQKNKPIYYELVMENASSFVSPDGGARNLKMETSIVMKQELIEEDKNGVMKIAMTVLEATQKVNGVEKPFPSATNQTQIVTMQKNGKIISMLTPYPGQSPEQNAMQMVFPEKLLTAGDTWTSIKDIAEPIPVETKTLYKITELTPATATISSIMKLKNSGGDAISATTEGKTIFDHVAGRITKSFANSKFQFEIPLKVPGLLPNNSNVKVTLTMNIKINEIEK
jgi:hypothetical protein